MTNDFSIIDNENKPTTKDWKIFISVSSIENMQNDSKIQGIDVKVKSADKN